MIRQFFQDPEWVSGLDSSIPKSLEELCSDDVVDNGTLWGGSDIRRIVQQHPDILHPDHGAWEVCLDWIRPFKGTQYSVGVLGIRCVGEPVQSAASELTVLHHVQHQFWCGIGQRQRCVRVAALPGCPCTLMHA